MKVRARRRTGAATSDPPNDPPNDDPPKPARKSVKGIPQKHPKKERSQDSKLKELVMRERVFTMRTQGISCIQIAKELGVERNTVSSIWERAFEDFTGDTNRVCQQKHAEQSARYERMIAAVSLQAYGGRVRMADGTIKTIEPDVKAMDQLRRITRDYSLHLAGPLRAQMNVQVNQLGATGSSETVHASAMEAARLIRESFPIKMMTTKPRTLEGTVGEIIDVEPEPAANEDDENGEQLGSEDDADEASG